MKKQFRVLISLTLVFTLLAMSMPAYAFAESVTVGYINTVAGTGTGGYSGDGGPANAAEIKLPYSVAVDASGNLYFADYGNNVIREMAAETHTQWGIAMTAGNIYTVAGNGKLGSGDGGPATEAGIGMPEGIAVDTAGNLYIVDTFGGGVREVAAETHTQWGITMTAGNIYTVAGGGSSIGTNYFFGSEDNVAATDAQLSPTGVAVDTAGNLYIASMSTNMIYEVAAADGIQRGIPMKAGNIYTVAGTGANGYSGDGGPAASAQLNGPQGVAVDTLGSIYIADTRNNVIRKVDESGLITTVAGSGTMGYSGDGGPATAAKLGGYYGGLSGVAVDASGNIYIADNENNVVREVAAATGMQWGLSMTADYIYTVAGSGTKGYSGDGGPATSAALDYDTGLALDPAGNLYIADYGNNRIREVTTTLPLSAAPTLTSLPAGSVNSGYDSGGITQYVSVGGGAMPYTWSTEGLPDGLSMSANGRITGIPDGLFSGSVTVTVTDSSKPAAQTAKVSLSMSVNPVAPAIDPGGGTYDRPQTVNVSISAPLTGGQTIYYTTDNSDPTALSTVYTKPFALTLASGDTIVKARVYDPGTGLWSSLTSAVFTVVPTPAPPLASAPSAIKGTAGGTTKITISTLNNEGDTLAVEVSANSIATPDLGASPPVGDNVVNPYIPGSNLSAHADDYVGIFELDSNGKVVAFSQLQLSTEDILTPSVSVAVEPTDSLAGKSGTVSVSVVTSNVADGQSVTARLTDSGKNILASVAPADGLIYDNALTLGLNLPDTLAAGDYYVSVTVSGIPTVYTLYTVQTPPPPPIKIITTPSVATGTATGITGYQATLNGSINYDGGAVCTQAYFMYKKQGESTWQYTTAQSVSLTTGMRFAATITGLSPRTKYEYAALASNSAGAGMGRGQISTLTTANPPAVTTLSPTNISDKTLTFNGSITDEGDSPVTDCGFIYGPSSAWKNYNSGPPPTSDTHKLSVNPKEDGSLTYSSTMSGDHMAYYYLAYATNAIGTSYGSIRGFEVPLLTVTTLQADAIGTSTATLHGSVTGGNGPVKSYAFEWGTDPGSLQQVSASVGSDGSFNAKLTGLKPDTEYIFRAYAADTIGDMYGTMLNFATLTNAPIVDTTAVSGISGTEATLNGNIVKDNDLPVTDSGFLWGTSPQPDTRISISPGSDGHTFSNVISGLTGGTTYYVQAYAVNSAGIGYSDIISFTTPARAPVVKTMPTGELTATTAALKGYITKNNGLKITDSGFLWGLTPEPNNRVPVPAGSDGRTLSYNLTGFTGNTTYYIRAYAVNSAGIGYGDVISFKTPSRVPVVITQAPTAVRDALTKLNGYIKKNNGLSITHSGFLWGLSPQPDTKVEVSPGGDGRTLSYMIDLEGGTTYYVRAYAANSDGYGLGDVMSFTTPVLAPVVGTTSAVLDTDSYTLSLKGKIFSDGGAPLTEYGFRYNWDGVWTTLTLGQGNYTGDITASVDGLKSGLKPGATYYVQAFASNSAGTVYGLLVPFKTPGLPKLIAGIDKLSITTTTAILNGTITDTGGPDIPVTAYRFMYRQAGSVDWLAADYTEGSFGKVSFSFELDGLSPGVNYEVEAQACSIAGWGSSKMVSFAAGWGGTDKEMAVNMKAAGNGADAIATAIRSSFGDSDKDAFQVLQYAGFGLNDSASGLKNSSYKDSAARVADIFHSEGISAENTAGILQQVFEQDMSILSFGRPKSGPAPYGVAKTLYKSGYKLDDIITGLRTIYSFQPADFMNSYGLNLTSSSFGYSKDEIYSAFARIYGVDTLAGYLWNEMNSYRGANTNGILTYMASVLKNDAGVGSALKIAELLKGVDPPMSMAQLAGSLKGSGFSASDTGTALMQVYGGTDLQAVVFTLLNNTEGPYDTSAIENFLVKDMSLSAQQFVQVITAIDNNGHGSVWVEPEKILALLASYYEMNAQDTARIMYASGYTEAKDGTGYGMINLIYALMDYYHPASFYELIGIIKGSGASSLTVAQEMYSLASMHIMTGYWLTAYQQQGYTAVDAAAWCASTGKGYYGDIGSTIYGLLPAYYTARNSTQSCLNEIALAIKTVYNPDAATALKSFEGVNLSYSLGLTHSAIEDAITYAYQTDALTVIVQAMKDAGDPAIQVAHTLNQNFGINDQIRMAGYLARAGYGVGDVIAALDLVFYYNNHDSKAAIDALSQAGQSVFPQNPPTLGLVLRAIGCSTAASAVNTLYKDGYAIKDMAEVLKDSFGRTVLQALGDITGILGSDKQQQITSAVLDAYGLDDMGFVIYLKSIGYTASQILISLEKQCGISDLGKQVYYLKQAGYSEIDTLTALTPPGIVGNGTIGPGDLSTQLVAAVSDAYGNDAVLVYLQHWKGSGLDSTYAVHEMILAGITDFNKQASYLSQMGYGMLDAFYAMKENKTVSQYIEYINRQKDIIAAVAAAYGKDYVMTAFLIWQSRGVTHPERFYDIMDEELGITDPVQRFNYMKEAGYSDYDAFLGVVRYSRSDLIKVMIKVYGLSDPVAVGNQFRQLPHDVRMYYTIDGLASLLKKAYPDMSNVTLVKVLLASGFKVYHSNDGTIRGYLFSNFHGQKDDDLAAFLGTGSEDSLGLEPDDAAEVIRRMGYDLKDAVALMLKDKYTWPQLFRPIVNRYGYLRHRTEYEIWTTWDSSAIPVLKSLMDTYDIGDLASGDLAVYGGVSGGWAVYCDLIGAGFVKEDAMRAILKAGDTLTDLLSIDYDYYNHTKSAQSAIDIANTVWNIAVTDKWKKSNSQPYDAKISILDIARAMMNAGPDEGGNGEDRRFRYYPLTYTFNAMQSLAAKYMQAMNVTDVPTNIAALLIMREAGMSADDAASITAHEAFSKDYSILELLFDGPNPIPAIGELVQAGYGKNESITAVWNNSQWNFFIKVELSMMLNVASSSEELAEDATMFERIAAAIAPDIEGGTMVTQVSKLGIASDLFKIVSSGLNLNNAVNSDKASLIVISDLTPGNASPRKAGTTITWTCTAAGGGKGNLEYEFWVVPKSDGIAAAMGSFTADQLGQAYGKSNTFTWKPKAAGDYIISVWVRDSASTDSKFQSAYADFTVY